MNETALTIVIPAYNEEEILLTTVEEAISAATAELSSFEIIIVNDGSTDGTQTVADQMAKRYDEVSVIHQPQNLGVGAAYALGLERARFPNITLIPGDHAFAKSGVIEIFRAAGSAEIVISYRANPQARTLMRRVLSKICTSLLRVAIGCPIRDGHSMYVWPVEKARKIKVPADYRYHLVSLTTLMKDADTYTEIPVTLTPKPDASSGVMRFGTVFGLGFAMLRMLIPSYLRRGKKHPRKICTRTI
jgi:dolichol-phosphate mannosyltransferase